MSNPLAIDNFNALIVGDGAIGFCAGRGAFGKTRAGSTFSPATRVVPEPENPRLQSIKFDATDTGSVQAAAMQLADTGKRLHLVINTVGMLHSVEQQPEKRLRDVSGDNLMRAFAINAVLLPLLAQSVAPLVRHNESAVFASLSARVGSIEDNRSGGWYSYRASKAAHNMLLRTLAREWRLSHRNVAVIALHPGTVTSRLSDPFISAGYSKRVLSPDESAGALLSVISSMRAEDSGRFFDWRGEHIPW